MMIWVDGEFRSAADAGFGASDRGALLGDGLFETLCFDGGRVKDLDRHVARIRHSATVLGLPDPVGGLDLAGLCEELVARSRLTQAALRFTFTAGEGARGLVREARPEVSRRLSCAPLAAPPQVVRLHLTSIRRSASSPSARHKTLSYIDNVLARREAIDAGADMGLMLDTDGHIACADCANIFWLSGERIYTPALNGAVLPGTVREALCGRFSVEEGAHGMEALAAAQAVIVTNSLIGVVPVTAIGERLLDVNMDWVEAWRDALA
ncbi:aminotransferase class IV [Maricaulis sp.]|uniref:aminotransferase class IV n=1 Tax=Maricaulis sp. TaxID=1486257 RepID=UPI0026262BA8|nr:aminotransferase class IV [Maricaulis sp.]